MKPSISEFLDPSRLAFFQAIGTYVRRWQSAERKTRLLFCRQSQSGCRRQCQPPIL
jgi:hypothetical protein